jgi:hypothetical protein
VGDLRPVGGAAEIGHRQRGEAGSRSGRKKTAAGQSNGHGEPLMEDLEGNRLLLLKLVDAAMTGLTLEFGLAEHPVRRIPASHQTNVVDSFCDFNITSW